MLKSNAMQLSASEKSWLPWFGKNGKFALRWSTMINRRRYPVLEQTFEGIAATRVQILTGWAQHVWEVMEGMANEAERELPAPSSEFLQKLAKQAPICPNYL